MRTFRDSNKGLCENFTFKNKELDLNSEIFLNAWCTPPLIVCESLLFIYRQILARCTNPTKVVTKFGSPSCSMV